jgi:hypothetical protein
MPVDLSEPGCQFHDNAEKVHCDLANGHDGDHHLVPNSEPEPDAPGSESLPEQ